MSEDKKPTEVVITGVEIPTDELARLIAKVVIIAVAVAIPIYIVGLAIFVLVAALGSLMTGGI